MKHDKVSQFMALAGQEQSRNFHTRDEATRKLGAQLLLSEVLEFIIEGLGVEPEINGTRISNAEALRYHCAKSPNQVQMLDGLCDVAYTMYWNSLAFGLPLEAGFDKVCDNNLEKFVELGDWAQGMEQLPRELWHCHKNVTWPDEVTQVVVILFDKRPFAVGKDERGKVRKPAHFQAVSFEDIW